jgi:hypothetical protein
MKRLLTPLALFAVLALPSLTQAGGNSWIFRPSYYSHNPARPVEIGRRYAGGPAFTRPTGDYYQVGTRYLNSTINVGPYTWDNVRVIESWTQNGSQF